jgi:tetratricopeptide (TPR) repeat protein
VKAVTIELFARQANPPSQATFHEFRKISDRLTDPAARRDFHLTMAEAARAVDVDPAYRLEHLKLAFETGAIRKRDILSNTLVSIGEISASLGRTDDARAFYERFLEMFPRDGRIHLVQQRLKGLDHAANP